MNGKYRDTTDGSTVTVEDSSLGKKFKMVSWHDDYFGPSFAEMHVYEVSDLIVARKIEAVEEKEAV